MPAPQAHVVHAASIAEALLPAAVLLAVQHTHQLKAVQHCGVPLRTATAKLT
jgi:hypothetical protein